jgi:predicted AAA+ superfamily ATPase
MKSETVSGMISGLSRLMVVEDLPAWAPSMRSRIRLRGSAVRHFVDPSLAVAAVGADASRLLSDPEWFGFLFEGLVLRDIRVFSQLLGAQTYHYRDESGLEADGVHVIPAGALAQ